MGCDWWGRVKGKGKGKGCRYMSCGEDKGLGLVGGAGLGRAPGLSGMAR